MINCKSYIENFVSVAMIFVVLVPQAQGAESEKFQPNQVSCEIKVIPEVMILLKNVMDKQKKDTNHDPLEHIKRMDILIAKLKDFANQGSAEAMAFYGITKREMMVINLFTFVKHPFGVLPDTVKEEMITAYSYIYLASIIENERKKEALKVVGGIERLSKYAGYTAPPEWVKEAKANAEIWKNNCGQPPIS